MNIAKHATRRKLTTQRMGIDDERDNLAVWCLFARAKYAAAKKGPRQPGQRPGDLLVAAELLREAFEACWRAGYKGDDVAREMLSIIRES